MKFKIFILLPCISPLSDSIVKDIMPLYLSICELTFKRGDFVIPLNFIFIRGPKNPLLSTIDGKYDSDMIRRNLFSSRLEITPLIMTNVRKYIIIFESSKYEINLAISMNKIFVRAFVIKLISIVLTAVAKTNVTQNAQQTGKVVLKPARAVMIVRMDVNFAITKLVHVV